MDLSKQTSRVIETIDCNLVLICFPENSSVCSLSERRIQHYLSYKTESTESNIIFICLLKSLFSVNTSHSLFSSGPCSD